MTADATGQTTLAANASCRGFELSAVLPRADLQLAASFTSRTLAHAASADFYALGFAPTILEFHRRGAFRSPLKNTFALSEFSVLRV